MPTTRTTGDLLGLDLPALAHGCNCRGSMAGGIARQFQTRWPEMAAAYRERCLAGDFRLGDVMPWETPDVVIYSLATQVEQGADAGLEAIDSSVRAALADLERRGIGRLGVPRISAGIGGLGWREVSASCSAPAVSPRSSSSWSPDPAAFDRPTQAHRGPGYTAGTPSWPP